MNKINTLKNWYTRHEKYISSLSLLLGFIIDYITLQNIDAFRENLWIAINLTVAGFSIIYLNKDKKREHTFWIPNILQFSFGALLGSLLIFYFKSSSVSVAWPFLVIILFAIIANELYQKKYTSLSFRLAFFYFSIFSFLIFLIPLIFKDIGFFAFLLSGGVSLISIWIYIFILKNILHEEFINEKTGIKFIVILIFSTINLLYFANIIPPIPLVLKNSGVYHSIQKTSSGDFEAKMLKRNRIMYPLFKEKIEWREGDPLYFYSAIYSPGSINIKIIHEWQKKNLDGNWETKSTIPLSLSGGRSGGFRTFSKKQNLSEGFWRVNVETENGLVIGRAYFELIRTNKEPEYIYIIKN